MGGAGMSEWQTILVAALATLAIIAGHVVGAW
jgi:hypothetical protein